MKRVLEINVASNRGSTGRIAENIGLTLRSSGWECYIAHGRRYCGTSELNNILIGKKQSEYWHYIKSFLFDAHGLGSKAATQEFVKEIELIKPDIIHLHNIHGYFINYNYFFSYLKESGIPVVWTLHDCWPFTGHCVYFDRIGCDKWKTHCRNCPQRNSYPKSLMDRSLRNFDLKRVCFTSVSNMTIVPVSDWLRGLVEQSFLSKYPVHTIHNGIDVERFKPCESDFRKKYSLTDKFIVLGVADGYGERKGLLDYNLLSKKLGDNVIIVMVGLSAKDKENVSDKIIGLGRTNNQQELIDIYSTADVYINPTYEDNFPTTNLEALACGTPVITYRTGGSPEAIDEETGIVVEKGDLEGLKKAIETIRKNGKEAYSQQCRNRAVQYFNKDDRYEDYVRLYEEVMKR